MKGSAAAARITTQAALTKEDPAAADTLHPPTSARWAGKEIPGMVSFMKGPDEARFTEAFEEYLDPLFRFFLYRLGDRDRAKDLAHDTFARAWDYESRGGKIEDMKPFLFKTAHNLFKNELRARRPVLSLDALMEEGTDFVSDAVPADTRADAAHALRLVARLSPAHQEVIRMRYLDQLAVKEIATVLGHSETAVSVRIHRALQKLKELYEPSP